MNQSLEWGVSGLVYQMQLAEGCSWIQDLHGAMSMDDASLITATCYDASSGAGLQNAEESLDSWMTVAVDSENATRLGHLHSLTELISLNLQPSTIGRTPRVIRGLLTVPSDHDRVEKAAGLRGVRFSQEGLPFA